MIKTKNNITYTTVQKFELQGGRLNSQVKYKKNSCTHEISGWILHQAYDISPKEWKDYKLKKGT